MRIAKWAIGVALVGSLIVSRGTAQGMQRQQMPSEPGYAEADTTSVQQAGVAQAAYGYAETGDEMAAPPAPVVKAPSNAAADNWAGYGLSDSSGPEVYDTNPAIYGSYAGCGGAGCGVCMECSPLGEPLRIFGKHPSGIEAGGWISVGGHGNEFQAADNGPLGFNNLGNGVNVHQLWFYAGKETNTNGCGWDWGGRVDYVFGVDGPDTQATRGTQWDEDWDSGDYGSAIPQAYASIAIDYLTIKAGYFYTPIGYESVQAPQNFFYSHSYTQYYIEPFTHTGALATYDGFENFTFYGGWTAGWDTAFEQIDDSNMFLGGITYAPSEDASVTYMTSSGRLDSLRTGRGNTYMHSIVFEEQLTNRLKWVIQGDLHHRETPNRTFAAGGVNQYLFYKVDDYWSIGGRFEWLHDRDGVFVSPGLAAGNYYNLTAGVNWKPHANITLRPEVRYDWFSGTFRPGGLPFDNHTSDEQFSLGFDVIVLY